MNDNASVCSIIWLNDHILTFIQLLLLNRYYALTISTMKITARNKSQSGQYFYFINVNVFSHEKGYLELFITVSCHSIIFIVHTIV